MDITDKVVVITGGGRGLGAGIAEKLAQRGARLALVARSADQLDATAEACGAHGAQAKTYPVDISTEANVVDLFDRINADFGALDVLVNNAGVTRDGLLVKVKDGQVVKKMSLEDWQRVIDVNLTGAFLCGREAARCMIERGRGGVIVNMSSINRAGSVGQCNYAASKAGLAAMTVSWAKELSRYGIRVAALAPGYCDTDMVAKVRPEILDSIIGTIPMRRLGRPDEVGHTVCYLIENDYVTGRVIEMDGGLRI